jgi:hypothetical protein
VDSTPDRIELEIFTWHSLVHKGSLLSLLQAFESYSDLAPTHWSSDDSEDPKATYQPYSRDQFLVKVTDLDEYSDLPGLCRKKRPKYESELLNNAPNLMKEIGVTFDSNLRTEDLPQIFEWSETLVSSVDAEFAFLDPFWDGIDYEYNHSAGLKADEFQSFGLISISACTWFGPKLVKIIGRELLCNCGGFVQDTRSGGIRLDLVEEPWQADAETLSIAQKRVMQNLERSGVFGDYTQILKYKPGANWTSIPQPVESL